jgi:hypothetical protein
LQLEGLNLPPDKVPPDQRWAVEMANQLHVFGAQNFFWKIGGVNEDFENIRSVSSATMLNRCPLTFCAAKTGLIKDGSH